jgi:hypothetical protein
MDIIIIQMASSSYEHSYEIYSNWINLNFVILDGMRLGEDGFFGVSELSNKHGPMIGTPFKQSYIDNAVMLYGPYNVVGRTVTVHADDGSRVACCEIKETKSRAHRVTYPPPLQASCIFNNTVQGRIDFMQPSSKR